MKDNGIFFICKFNAVSSTQDEFRELLGSGIIPPPYSVISADYQTAGRGRQGRSWSSAGNKNALFSFITYPGISVEYLPALYQLAAVAVADILYEMANLYPEIKYPNDILLNGKKTAGVLIETHLVSGRVNFAITGIGLNVNQMHFHDGINATSVKRETGREWPPDRWIEAIVNRYKWLAEIHSSGEIFSRYLFWWNKPGVKKGIVFKGKKIRGKITKIEQDRLYLKNNGREISFPVREIQAWI